MVKQTKTFKKGNVTKKALSAILAASMVMTSSSFVMAAPVEVEDVAVESTVEAVDVVEDVEAGEESVGEKLTAANVTLEDVTYNGAAYSDLKTALKVVVKDEDGKEIASSKYTVTEKDSATVQKVGDYTAVIEFTDANYAASGKIEKAFKVKPFELSASNVSVAYTESSTGYFYNANEQKPGFNATVNNAPTGYASATVFELVPYNTSYDMKSAGTQRVKLQLTDAGKENYVLTGELSDYSYTIDKAKAATGVTVSAEPMVYTGSAVTPDVVVKDADGKTVLDPSTYDVKITKGSEEVSPVDVGSYNITVTTNGKGNYEAGLEINGTFSIVKSSLATASKTATIKGATKTDATGSFNGIQNMPIYETVYNGKSQQFSVEDITIPGLTLGVDYKLGSTPIYAIENADNQCVIVLEGINKYQGDSAGFFIKVAKKEINTTDFTITAKASKDAADNEIIVSVKDGDKDLEKGQDFTVSDINRTKKTLVVKGIGNYTTQKAGETTDKGITVSYTQSEKTLIDDNNKVTLSIAGGNNTQGNKWIWTGKQLTPKVTATLVSGGTSLVEGTDFTVTYGENVNTGIGAGTVTVTGMGNYEGSKVIKFDIEGTSISGYKLAMSDVSLDEAKAGNGQSTPRLVYESGATAPLGITYGDVKYFAGTKDITKSEDFAAYIAGLKNENLPVIISVEATGTGKYSGKVTGSYKILKGDDTIAVDAIADQNYTGKAIEPEVVVKDSTKKTLVKGTDYTVSYDNNVKVGTAYVTVKGIGKYTGTKVVSFNIVGEMDQTIEVLAAQERDLGNGSRTLNSKATKIKFATAPETAVTYTSSDENVVTVDAEGNVKYTGIGEATITIEAKAENGYKAAKKEVKVVVTLAKPSFTPFSKNNAFTLTSSTVKGAEKFEVEYATKKDFSNSKTKTFATTSAGKIRQVKVSAGDKKTYYVRVRAISGTTKSAWSATKTVATK